MSKSLCRCLWLLLVISLVLLALPAIALAQSVPGFTVTTFATGLTGAREVSTDPAGNVYSMGRDSGIVYKISPAGVVSVLANLGAGSYVGPHFDPVSGDLVVSTCSGGIGLNSILRINSSGGVSTFVSGLTCPAGFASDASGNIYASEFVSPGRVVKITPGGIVSTYATGLSFPDGIDFGPGGELYVGNRGTNQVMRVPPGGGAATVFASGFSLPLDVLADNAGNVYAANFGNGTISKISPASAVSTFGTGFANPLGLAFDPSGNLFIADFGTGVIYKVAGVGPPLEVPFAAFTAKVEMDGEEGELEVKAAFTLGAGSNGIDIPTEIVSLELTGGTGAFSTTIPPGAFKQDKKGRFEFEGIIDGVELEVAIRPLGGGSFEFKAEGKGADLTGTVNPVEITLTIGNDTGTVSVTAKIDDDDD